MIDGSPTNLSELIIWATGKGLIMEFSYNTNGHLSVHMRKLHENTTYFSKWCYISERTIYQSGEDVVFVFLERAVKAFLLEIKGEEDDAKGELDNGMVRHSS